MVHLPALPLLSSLRGADVFGELEGILDQVEAGEFAVFQDDLQDVEAEGRGGLVEVVEPADGPAGDEALLGVVHSGGGAAPGGRAAGFDLDEGEDFLVAGGDVDFAAFGSAEVGVEGFHAVFYAEVVPGQALAQAAQRGGGNGLAAMFQVGGDSQGAVE